MKSSNPIHLLFIALVPDERIQKEATRFKEYAAAHFHSSRALNAPPHITLISPFKLPENEMEGLYEALEPFASEETVFLLGLKNFSCFPPRVIFVDVERKIELLSLQNRLEAYLTEALGVALKRHRDFNPHMTVAFKDLSRKAFPEAWAYFSQMEYEREFLADALALLEHNGKRWEVLRRFAFSNI